MYDFRHIHEAMVGYWWEGLTDEVANVVREKLLKLEKKKIAGRAANAMVIWAKAIINTKQVNL